MTDLNQSTGQKRQEGIIEKTTDTLVVGAGQAGVAMSEHLSTHGVPHLVLESKRIAEAWRTGRWDSLVANGPAWHDRFPGLEFDSDPDAFVPKEQAARPCANSFNVSPSLRSSALCCVVRLQL